MSQLTVLTNPQKVHSANKLKGLFYLLFWLVGNAMIWGGALGFLKYKPPSYSSNWTVNVPASATNTNVSVPDIGQASSNTDSPYKIFADPREIYKILAENDDVIEAAAKHLKIPVKKFGKPRIKILDNTTFMRFEITAQTPVEAQRKGKALHMAFVQYVNRLRNEENSQQDKNLEVVVKRDREKLEAAKQLLYKYKLNSSLSSTQQVSDLSTNLEVLRRQQAETQAQLQQINARVIQLSASLGLSPREAADALALQSDKLFQQYLAKYSEVSSELIDLSAKYAPENPVVINKQEAQQTAVNALVKQGKLLLGRSLSPPTLAQIIQNGAQSNSGQRSALFQDLITLQTQQKGFQAQALELEKQVKQLDSRMKLLSIQKSNLDSLERDVKIAEAVFSSNLTKLNLSKPSQSNSYPEIGLVTRPNLATQPNIKPEFVLLGAVAGSFFLTTGILALILRERQQQKAKQLAWLASINANSINSNSTNPNQLNSNSNNSNNSIASKN